MAGRHQVFSWPSELGDGAKQTHGCFDTEHEAERFIMDAAREHPERTYEHAECSHPEHQRIARSA
jgi:hypothetical protein